MNDDAIERLEIKLAFLERTTNELSDVIYKQQQDIVALNDKVAALAVRFDSLRTAETPYTAEDENPPHY